MTWTRSERPDGHRSLWHHLGRWYTIESCASFGERVGAILVRVGPKGEPPVACPAVGMEWITARWGVPAPSAEDLAWLRDAPK